MTTKAATKNTVRLSLRAEHKSLRFKCPACGTQGGVILGEVLSAPADQLVKCSDCRVPAILLRDGEVVTAQATTGDVLRAFRRMGIHL